MISEGTNDWSWKHDCDVSHTLKAFADAHHEIVESDESNNTLEKSIRVECVEPSGSFTATSFTARCLETGPYANHINCELSYQNDLGEQALIVFIFKKASTGEVIGKARPYGHEGSSGVGALFECPPGEPGTYRLSWEAYRASDIYAQTPVAQCENSEELEVSCPCGGAGEKLFDRATTNVNGRATLTISNVRIDVTVTDQHNLLVSDATVEGYDFETKILLFSGSESHFPGVKIIEKPSSGTSSSSGNSRIELQAIVTIPAAIMVVSAIGMACTIYDYYQNPGEFPVQIPGLIEGSKRVRSICLTIDGNDLAAFGGALSAGLTFFKGVQVLKGATPIAVGLNKLNLGTTSAEVLGAEFLKTVEPFAHIMDKDRYNSCQYIYETDDAEILMPYTTFTYVSGPEEIGYIDGTVMGRGKPGMLEDYPLEGATVTAFCQNCSSSGEAHTHSDGSYLIDDLEHGKKYTVQAHAPDYTLEQKTVRNLSMGQCKTVNFTLEWVGQITPEPVACFNASPTSREAPLTVEFDSSCSSGEIDSYYWEFGDGETSTEKNPSHTYDSPNEYTVKLTVEGSGGEEDTTTKIIEVQGEEAPIANFTFSPLETKVGEEVSFDASLSEDPDGNVEKYKWDFDDGTGTDWGPYEEITHAYDSEDTYEVCLRVKDDEDLTSELVCKNITISRLRVDAKLVSCDVLETVQLGDKVSGACRVQNTGEVPEDFEIHFSVEDPYGKTYPEDGPRISRYQNIGVGYHNWADFTASGHDLLIEIPSDAAIGTYEALFEVWGHNTGEKYDTMHAQFEVIGGKLTVTTTCPVDLQVTDPEGFVVNKQTSQIPGATYTEKDLNDDGDPDDQIVIPSRKLGNYQVLAIPEPGANPIDRFTLEVSAGGKTTVLANNQQIKDLPEQAYEFQSSNNIERTIALLAGCNLISLGLAPEDPPHPEAIFDEISGSLDLRHWNSTTGTWETVTNGRLTELDPLEGYYIWVPEEVTVLVEGMPLTGDQTLTLEKAGWQQIGVPYKVAWGLGAGGSISVEHSGVVKSLSDAVAAGWISGTISEWDNENKRWNKPTVVDGLTLDPWTGYWIYTFVDNLTLHFSETPALGVGSQVLRALRAGREPKSDLPGQGILPTESLTETLALRVINVPNPVRDVHTTIFKALGICSCHVQGLRVEIYDLSGRLVWQDETSAPTLSWHTEDSLGDQLANGVYLYCALVKIGGEWIATPVQKLAILR